MGSRTDRKLALHKETLRLLQDSELRSAAAGVKLTPQCPTNYCVPFTQWFRTCDCVDLGTAA